MTSKRRQATRARKAQRQSLDEARDLARTAAADDIVLDPASELFFQFAAPLLMTAKTEEEFDSAAAIAEFVWATSHFDAGTQALLIDGFIQEVGIPPDMVPWLLEVYAELAARKEAMVG
jgi:hypothetical protein